MPESEAADFRERWSRIQSDFVDDPRESVREADELVAAVMQHLAGTFASHKEELEKQWGSGEEVATEDPPAGLPALPLLLRPPAHHLSPDTAARRPAGPTRLAGRPRQGPATRVRTTG
ncbi:hypothetical protein [Streptomyces sp. CS62]|uniref:hypothetical protein n=1 Tax=Streptomyces sp. CS62 TaxID=3119268 RepID=UPI002F9246F4